MSLKQFSTLLIGGMVLVLSLATATAFGQTDGPIRISDVKSIIADRKSKPVPDTIGTMTADELQRQLEKARSEGKAEASVEFDKRIREAAVKVAADLELEKSTAVSAAMRAQREAVRPTIELENVTETAETTERRPRGLLLVTAYCQPCERMQTELADLIGDETAIIQVVDTTRANDLDEYGINLNAIGGFPVLTQIDETGKVHDVKNGMMTCFRRGYSNRQQVVDYLTQHRVVVTDQGPPSIVFGVANASATSAAAAALDFVITDDALGDTDEFAFKTWFDVEFDAPDLLRSHFAEVLRTGKVSIPDVGLSISWPGERTLKTKSNRVDIVPGLVVSKTIGRFNASRTLDAVTWNDDLSTINLELRNSPDVQIRLR